MIEDFKKFINQGNVLDLAVGLVIGAAFAVVINAFVEGLINPLIGLILPNTGSLQEASFSISDSTFRGGAPVHPLEGAVGHRRRRRTDQRGEDGGAARGDRPPAPLARSLGPPVRFVSPLTTPGR